MGEKTRKLVCQPDVAALVPEALARRYEFFPLRCSGGVLKVAVAEPLSAEAHDTLRFVVEREFSETLYPAEISPRPGFEYISYSKLSFDPMHAILAERQR